LTFWLTFVVWLPAVLFLANRFRLTWPLQWRRLLIHVAGSCTFAVVQIGSAAWLDPVRARTWEAFSALFAAYMTWNAAQDVLSYWAVAGSFYAIHYYRESKRSEVRSAQLERLLADARLGALRAQLNPHFLFNTLNTITVLSRKGEQAAVTAMLTRLSTLLRIALDDTLPREIPLARELAFLEGYLDIQKMRFADRLTVHRDIEPDSLSALVPCMMLQPLVENAVVHGVARRRGAGSIVIQAFRSNGTLRIRVTDDGPGFGSDREMNGAVREDGRGRGIGLANTRARLAELYGADQGVECDDGAHGGIVTISLPFHTSSNRSIS
jgi:LytS/YehU family sensor histidine kinase